MVKKTLVNYLHNLVDKFEKEGKPFNLVMLIPVDAVLSNKFTVIFSAPWLDSKNPRDAIDLMIEAIIEQMGSPNVPEFSQLSRITIIHTSDPFVTDLNAEFCVTGSGLMNISNSYVNSTHIESAIILLSQRTSPLTTTLSSPPPPVENVHPSV
ncbi:MAG: hypothetical protein HQK60_08600 [Deltaproteobacteria bacterium]|nr:hypothetical protein [Deltaproteobacteria bacterium]